MFPSLLCGITLLESRHRALHRPSAEHVLHVMVACRYLVALVSSVGHSRLESYHHPRSLFSYRCYIDILFFHSYGINHPILFH
jgi:hypothetical protein